MKTEHFYQASAIRQYHRAGWTIDQLTEHFDQDAATLQKVLACRTREAAAKVLEDKTKPTVCQEFRLKCGITIRYLLDNT